MQRNFIEAVLGAVVLAGAGTFLWFAVETGEVVETAGSYELQARFTSVEGLSTGNDVAVGGVKVGTVTRIELDPQNYLALVSFTVREGIELPLDTSASVTSSGLLGGKYLSLEPGGDPDMLQPGDVVEFTSSSASLESLLGQAIFSLSRGGEGGGGEGGSGGGAGSGSGFGDGWN